MATIKSYTDVSQSKKLTEILSPESADMRYGYMAPCWSLASLLEQLPYEVCDDDGNSLYLEINKEDDIYQLVYADRYGDFESIETDRYYHFVDACYEMVVRLRELNLL